MWHLLIGRKKEGDKRMGNSDTNLSVGQETELLLLLGLTVWRTEEDVGGSTCFE